MKTGFRRLARWILIAALMLLMSAATPITVFASPMQENEIPILDAAVFILQGIATDFSVGGFRGMAEAVWTAEKLTAILANLLAERSFWDGARDLISNSLQSVAKPMLISLLAGDSTLPGGLIYVALMLSGLVMMLPMLGTTRFVKAERVVVWGVIVGALFVSSTIGFDLISFAEQMRLWLGSAAFASGGGSSSASFQVARLVGVPMLASDDEINFVKQGDLTFTTSVITQRLPSNFVKQFFPAKGTVDVDGKPVPEIVSYTVVVFGPFKFTGVKFETIESMERRSARAWSGFIRALIVLPAAYVALQYALVYAMLSIAALIIIVFFVAALPLGFFEFGATILSRIVRQYFSILALTLLVGVLARIMSLLINALLDCGTLQQVSGCAAKTTFTDTDFIAYLALLLITAIALSTVVKMAWSAMTGTFDMMERNIRTSITGGVGGGLGHHRGRDVVGEGLRTLTTAAVAAGGVALGVPPQLALAAGNMAGNNLASRRARSHASSLPVSTQPNAAAADTELELPSANSATPSQGQFVFGGGGGDRSPNASSASNTTSPKDDQRAIFTSDMPRATRRSASVVSSDGHPNDTNAALRRSPSSSSTLARSLPSSSSPSAASDVLAASGAASGQTVNVASASASNAPLASSPSAGNDNASPSPAHAASSSPVQPLQPSSAANVVVASGSTPKVNVSNVSSLPTTESPQLENESQPKKRRRGKPSIAVVASSASLMQGDNDEALATQRVRETHSDLAALDEAATKEEKAQEREAANAKAPAATVVYVFKTLNQADRYNELIAEGTSPIEAMGIVREEFGIEDEGSGETA